MCLDEQDFLRNSTEKMEDSNLNSGYKSSFAGGDSGLSFGGLQLDVRKNALGRSAFREALQSSGSFSNAEIQDIIDRAVTSGVNQSDFNADEIAAINNALSSPTGQQIVDNA